MVRVLWWLRFGWRMAWMLFVLPLVVCAFVAIGAVDALLEWARAVRDEWREA